MPKAKLDRVFAMTARCEEGRKKTDWYDETITGFVLECRSTGGKTFYLRYDHNGRQRQVKLAAFGDAPFAQIKRKAEKLRAEVSLGGDPAAAKAEAKAVPIYAELAAMHMADAKLHQRSYSTTEAYMRNHVVVRWGRVRLTDIDSRSVAHWLASKRDEGLAPATVLKIKMIFSRSFELGARWGIAGCDKNPVRAVQSKPVNNARQRYVTADEAARLITAAGASRNRQLAAVVQLLLLTGMRVSELLSSRWADVDLDRRTLFVDVEDSTFAPRPLGAGGGGRHRSAPAGRVPVPQPAGRGEAPYDDQARVADRPRPRRPSRLRIHDLRHSAASFMVNSGVDLFAVGKVLGHANVASTARYSHLANDTLLAAVEAGAAKQSQPA